MQRRAGSSLDSLAVGAAGAIGAVAWDALGAFEAQRLREFGLVEGAIVTVLHRGTWLSRDPVAVSIGRMRVMIRSAQAMHITVAPRNDLAPHTDDVPQVDTVPVGIAAVAP